MKRTILLGTLTAALLAPFTVAHAYSNVSVSVSTPEFGIRIGGPVFHPVPVYSPVPVYAPVPVFAPVPVYAPRPRLRGAAGHLPRAGHRGASALRAAALRSARVPASRLG